MYLPKLPYHFLGICKNSWLNYPARLTHQVTTITVHLMYCTVLCTIKWMTHLRPPEGSWSWEAHWEGLFPPWACSAPCPPPPVVSRQRLPVPAVTDNSIKYGITSKLMTISSINTGTCNKQRNCGIKCNCTLNTRFQIMAVMQVPYSCWQLEAMSKVETILLIRKNGK